VVGCGVKPAAPSARRGGEDEAGGCAGAVRWARRAAAGPRREERALWGRGPPVGAASPRLPFSGRGRRRGAGPWAGGAETGTGAGGVPQLLEVGRAVPGCTGDLGTLNGFCFSVKR